MTKISINEANTFQLTSLTLLRIFIGWHFLHEGLVKFTNTSWSAYSYLNNAEGPFEGLFESMADSESTLAIINTLNVWGLILIGLSLLLGLYANIGKILGIVLLFLYYIARPPFIGIDPAPNAEGHYLIINKILIELVALLVLLAFPSSKLTGIDRWILPGRKA